MSKIVDDNGFWLIENNPISKEGVFPYLGKTISPQLEPNRIYNVYRPFNEISKEETLKSFDGVPFINGHEMIGENFTPYDKRTADGVLMNVKANNGMLFGDLKIFSEDMKSKIQAGKKELSLGYKCDYKLSKGVFNGMPYDAIQCNLRGNHIALVDKGRMGGDVRVYDNNYTFDTLDIDINNEEKKMSEEKEKEIKADDKKICDEKVDKRKLIDEVGGILKDKVSEEIWRTVIGKIEKASYNDSEKSADDEEEKKTEVKEVEKKEEVKKEDDTDKKDDKVTEEVKEEEKEIKKEEKEEEASDDFIDQPKFKKYISEKISDKTLSEEVGNKILGDVEKFRYARSDKKTTASDSSSDIFKTISKQIAKRNELAKTVSKYVGDFACDEMTEAEVAQYACEKLGMTFDSADEAIAKIGGFITAKTQSVSKTFSLDEKDVKKSKSRLETYLENKR
jgi:hypothetical protein